MLEWYQDKGSEDVAICEKMPSLGGDDTELHLGVTVKHSPQVSSQIRIHE